MLQNWNRNGIRIHNSRVKKTKNDLGLAVKMIYTVHCWEKEIRRKRESHACWGSPGDSYTRNMVAEQLKDLWEIVGTRKRIYNCDKSHFPNMATNSHTSHAFVKHEFDISLSAGEGMSPALEYGQALAAVWPAEYKGGGALWRLSQGQKRQGRFHPFLLEHLLRTQVLSFRTWLPC